MRYWITFALLFGTSYAHSADWTPVFADTLTPQSQQQLLGKQKPVKNFYPNLYETVVNGEGWTTKGVRLTANAQKVNYPIVPAPYRHDMQPAIVTKTDNCTYLAKVPLVNATLFGKPLQSIDYGINTCEMTPIDSVITFKPMSDVMFKQLQKQVKFKQKKVSRSDAECTEQTSYPAGEIRQEGGKVTFALGTPDSNCG